MSRRTIVRSVLLACVVGCVVPASAGALVYGISDGSITDLSSPAFTPLETSHGGRISYARIFIPYDTFGTYNGSTCVQDNGSGGVGTSYWYDSNGQTSAVSYVLAWLAEAKYQGLTPVVTFAALGSNGGNPADPSLPSGAGQRGYLDYYCAVYVAMLDTYGVGLPVTHWEAFNEPDHVGVSADNAAQLWTDADLAASYMQTGYHVNEEVAAGAFENSTMYNIAHGGSSYFNTYANDLVSHKLWPAIWSGHPYDQITSAGSIPETKQYVVALDNLYGKVQHPYIWLTEASDRLDLGDYPGTNGNPTAQRNAGLEFLNLPLNDSTFTNQIDLVSWYELQDPNGAAFDSGLISPGRGTFTSPDGLYQEQRQSWCVLANQPSGNCSSGVVAAADWGNPADWVTCSGVLTYVGPGGSTCGAQSPARTTAKAAAYRSLQRSVLRAASQRRASGERAGVASRAGLRKLAAELPAGIRRLRLRLSSVHALRR